MRCQTCGKDVTTNTGYCPHCGQPIANQSYDPDETQNDMGIPASPPASPSSIKKYLPYGIAGCGVLLVAALVFVVILVIVFGGGILPVSIGSGSQAMIAFPYRNGTFDLYLLKFSQEQSKGVLLAENASKANAYSWLQGEDAGQNLSDYELGGFIPGTSRILYWYGDEDTILLNTANSSGKDIKTILESNEEFLYTLVPEVNTNMAMIVEPKGGDYRCYISRKWNEAIRLGKGANCGFPADGKFMVVSDVQSEKTTLIRIETASEKETILLEDETGVGWFLLSNDGNLLAYLKQKNSEEQIIVIDAGNGNLVWESADYEEIPHFAFAASGRNFALSANDGRDKLDLIVYHGGSEIEIVQSYGLDFHYSQDGKYLLYQAMDDDGEVTLFSYNLAKDSSLEITTMKAPVAVTVLAGQDGFLFLDTADGDATLYYVDANGQNLTEIFQQRNGSIDQVLYQEGETKVLIVISSQDGKSLVLSPYNQADKTIMLVEDWAEMYPMNISSNGKTLILKGKPDAEDDWALFAVDLTGKNDPEELDDEAEDYLNAVFSKNSREVIYTVRTDFDGNDVEIRQKKLNSKDRSVVIYEEAVLESVQWAEINPFQSLYFASNMNY